MGKSLTAQDKKSRYNTNCILQLDRYINVVFVVLAIIVGGILSLFVAASTIIMHRKDGIPARTSPPGPRQQRAECISDPGPRSRRDGHGEAEKDVALEVLVSRVGVELGLDHLYQGVSTGHAVGGRKGTHLFRWIDGGSELAPIKIQ